MRRGFSTPAAGAAFVSTLLVIGIIGWSAGWLAAGAKLEQQGRIDPTTSSEPSQQATTPSPSVIPSPARTSGPPTSTPSPTRTDTFAMPDLVNQGFRTAKQAAEAKKLSVNIHFREKAFKPDGTVARTFPEEKTLVWPGVTVQLYVTGEPPATAVPEIVGKTCHEGAELILGAGLKIQEYPSGRTGHVRRSDPEPGKPLKWNDQVKLYCSA